MSRVQTFLVSGVVLGTVSCEAANRTVAQPLAVCLKAYLCNSKTSEVIFFFLSSIFICTKFVLIHESKLDKK